MVVEVRGITKGQETMRKGRPLPDAVSKVSPPPNESIGDDGPMARILAVLESVSALERPVSLREVEHSTNLPKATAHRILGQLERMGFVERALGSRLYAPGARLASLGIRSLRSRWMNHEGHLALTELVRQVNETCNITVLDGFQVRIIDRVETSLPLRYVLDTHCPYPIHRTASGKLFLARMPEAQRRRYLDTETMTPNGGKRTPAQRRAFERQLRQTLDDRYALDNEELVTGMVAIAVPIEGQGGRLLGAVAINAARARHSAKDLVRFLPLLDRTAARLAAIVEPAPT